MGASDGNEPRLAGEQLLHHRLLEVAGLITAGLQRRQLGVHVGEDGGDGEFARGLRAGILIFSIRFVDSH